MKLPLLSGREVYAALQRLGFVEIHRKGSHVKMEHGDGRRIVFPYHGNSGGMWAFCGAICHLPCEFGSGVPPGAGREPFHWTSKFAAQINPPPANSCSVNRSFS